MISCVNANGLFCRDFRIRIKPLYPSCTGGVNSASIPSDISESSVNITSKPSSLARLLSSLSASILESTLLFNSSSSSSITLTGKPLRLSQNITVTPSFPLKYSQSAYSFAPHSLNLIDKVTFAHISRNRSNPFTESNAAGTKRKTAVVEPHITPDNSAAMELKTILTTNFGFLLAFGSILVIASNRPEILIEIKGNEYDQNAKPIPSALYANPRVFHTENNDNSGKKTKTVNPNNASL